MAELQRLSDAGQSLSFAPAARPASNADPLTSAARRPPADPPTRPTLTQQDQINAGIAALAARRAAAGGHARRPARMPLAVGLPLQVVAPTAEPTRPDAAALVVTDLELLRCAVKCHKLPVFRLWTYAHKAAAGRGWIAIDALEQTASAAGIVGSRRNLMHLIASGKRLFFRPDYAAGRVYLVGSERVAIRLARRAGGDTNRPGSRRIVIDLAGPLATVEARAYAAWIAQKAAKTGYLDVSRATLCKLWNRSVNTLLKWEKSAGVRVESCYAEYHPELTDPLASPINHRDLIPDHAYLCMDKRGRDYVAWQTVNRYFAPQKAAARLHDHAGNTRKIRKAVNAKLGLVQPAKVSGRGHVGSNTGRLYFADSDPASKTPRNAHQKVSTHLRKHGDIHKRPHYAYTCKRHGRHIREMSFGVQNCPAGIRDYKAESGSGFRQRRAAYAAYLRGFTW